MKSLLIAVAVLLAANLAWLVVRHRHPGATPPAAEGQGANRNAPVGEGSLSSPQLSVLKSGDVKELMAVGLPEDLARQLLAGRAYARMRERGKAVRRTAGMGADYWKLNPYFGSGLQKAHREMSAINQDYMEDLRIAYGDDSDAYSLFEDRYSSLPPAKRDLLRRIERDYGEMISEIHAEIGGFPLPSDQEKLKLLEDEKQRDILAALTPEEAEEFNLRSSPTAYNIRSMYGGAIKSEAQYRKIFALQKAYDDRYNTPRFDTDPARQAAVFKAQVADDRKLEEDLRREVGEEAYEALRRGADQDLRTLKAMEQRLHLPAGTADAVYASRDTYAAQSRAITDDASLSQVVRRDRLQALAKQATTEFQARLGAQGAELYSQRSQWIQMLKNGVAFSADPNDAPPGMFVRGSSVFPVHAKPPAPSAAGSSATK